jgi:hypothetical protein
MMTMLRIAPQRNPTYGSAMGVFSALVVVAEVGRFRTALPVPFADTARGRMNGPKTCAVSVFSIVSSAEV